MNLEIPKEVKFVLDGLKTKGFQAYAVGGCVRDILRGEKPADWDITTNAAPEQIGSIFLESFSNNKFGTVTVIVESEDPALREIEVTPFRTEQNYSDKRHPDEVKWAKTIEEDLSRRDFTVNALALDETAGKISIIDLFNGQKDLRDQIIRTVGSAEERFNEDALRMLRAIRFSATLGEDWKIEPQTQKAIESNAHWLKAISQERISEELCKIIKSRQAAQGIETLRIYGLLQYILPELMEGYKVGQNKHHVYDVYEHCVRCLDFTAKKDFNFHVRMASLLHDIGKPRSKRGEGLNSTFYGHDIIGAKMCAQALQRLKFSKKDNDKVTLLVRYHLFYYNVDEVGESSIRRLVRNVGPENMEELLQVRMADRIGSGCPKAEPYKLRHLKYIVDKVAQDPISAKMLKADGQDVMKILEIKPGPKIGDILDILLGIVLLDPKKNTKKFLEGEIKKLGKMSDEELAVFSQKAKEERGKTEVKRDEMTKKKYWVT
ncbi:MAG: CCA tRNA nucleotidyltransferase [Candidatus Paceibacterota bacterium]|jgi:poly(A) polymerase/tRNA nucleotidyltransferase (CCA-adding enzyme)